VTFFNANSTLSTTCHVAPTKSPPSDPTLHNNDRNIDYARSLLFATVARTMGLDRTQTLLASLVAFVAWALLTDWLPSLRWIPHALVAGSLATVLGLLFLIATTSRGVQHSQLRSIQGKPVAWRNKETWEEEKAALLSRTEYRRPVIFPEARKFSKAVDGLLDLILRDFVSSWYAGISKRPTFQNEIDRSIRSVLLTVAARLTGVDLVELGVSRILPLVTGHLREFYEAERAVRGKDLGLKVTESEELDMAIAAKYNGGKMHAAAALGFADTAASQQRHLREMVKKLLPIVLPENMKTSSAVSVLVQEIVACAVLTPVLNMMEDPDFWNQMIVNIGGPMLQDRKTVRKLRAALDQHAPASSLRGKKTSQFPRLRPYDSERQFERFIRAIRNINLLSEARRYRSEVVSQLRRDTAVENQDAAYLQRLETGKRLLDQKIATLPAANGKVKPTFPTNPSNDKDAGFKKRQASLRDLLYDASGLSYFMEYMDRVKLMRIVQFWLVVDGFRDPLETDTDEPPPGIAADPGRLDIGQMYEAYLVKPELQTPPATLEVVRRFLKMGSKASADDYIAARRAVLHAQSQTYERMKREQFEDFKRSDLYYKWLAIDDNPSMTAMQNKQTGSRFSSDSTRNASRSPARPMRPPLAINREPELRRAVLSTSDLRSITKPALAAPDTRRSMDDSGARPALFEDEVEDERMTQSITSVRSYDSDGESARQAQEEAKAVDAMQLALDNIVGDDDRDSLFSETGNRRSLEIGDRGRSTENLRPPLIMQPSGKGKPSIASLGLVGQPSSRGVFVDDLFAEEAGKFAEDEKEDSDAHRGSDEDRVQEAAPGDLGLTEAISALNQEIERLQAQKSIVDSLTTKAELTNNTAELRILRKSEQSLQREIKRKEMQKQQYVVQESDNSLFGRAAVTIKSVMVGHEDDGHEYALYVIEVRRQAGENMAAATWAVARRYSQFHELHKRLRARFPAVRELDFPRRQALFTLQKEFLNRRRQTLEKYLRSLLLVPAICRSRELRAFLSQASITSSNGENNGQDDASRDFVTRIYNSVSDGMEDFLGNIPVLDQLSVAGQNLISAATSQMNANGSESNSVVIDSLDPSSSNPTTTTTTEAEAELRAYENSNDATNPATKELEPFIKPICDLFLELFELAKGNSWLRGRTVVVVLHQLLGGTIERKIHDSARSYLEDDKLESYVLLLQKGLWPDAAGGKFKAASVPRTAAEKALSRREAALVLGALIPDLTGSVVGRANAQAAGRKLGALLNNRRLNAHLVLTLLDTLVGTVFPEMATNASA
jgi:sorting nexin-25